ncbi:hypothetical protein GALL_490220 [mine drainage metagenome]|uniref:Uncharacterized protein n=1 Tax=mine drainage metagenome TaxID=410659 RepID=A0A1J5PVR8_9ZZZZ
MVSTTAGTVVASPQKVPSRPKKISRLVRYRVKSRASSIRVATESRILVPAVPLICDRAPRERSSDASGARSCGTRTSSCPGTLEVKSTIQRTEDEIWIACAKHAITPIANTTMIAELR